MFQDEEISINLFQVSPACREETHQKWLMPQCIVAELTSQSEECYDEILYKVMQVFVVTLLVLFLFFKQINV